MALDEGIEVQEVDLGTNLSAGATELGTVHLLNHTDVVVLELLGHLLEHLDRPGGGGNPSLILIKLGDTHEKGFDSFIALWPFLLDHRDGGEDRLHGLVSCGLEGLQGFIFSEDFDVEGIDSLFPEFLLDGDGFCENG